VRWKQTVGKAISKKSTRIKSRQVAFRGTKTRGSNIVPSDNKYKNSRNVTKKIHGRIPAAIEHADDFFEHLSKWQVVVCKKCQCAI
jgi:hypothetical protein